MRASQLNTYQKDQVKKQADMLVLPAVMKPGFPKKEILRSVFTKACKILLNKGDRLYQKHARQRFWGEVPLLKVKEAWSKVYETAKKYYLAREKQFLTHFQDANHQ